MARKNILAEEWLWGRFKRRFSKRQWTMLFGGHPIPLGGGAAADPTAALLAKFSGGGEVAIRSDAIGAQTVYYLSQHIGAQKYWTIELHTAEALSAGNEWMAFRRNRIENLYAGYNDQSTPAVTLNGAGWTTASGTYPGGRLMYHSTAGRYAELVTPAGVEAVGAIGSSGGNGGLILVSIDGDNTLATELPTAQQLVDAGTFPDTILVANGGSLNPTDRVWDEYLLANNYMGLPAFNAYNYTLFAKGMNAAAHTVRITCTGYKRAASANANIGFFMIIAYGSGLSNTVSALGNRTALIPELNILSVTGSYIRDEISYNTKPTGASAYEWIGHGGSLKFIDPPTCTVDGAAQTLSDNAQFAGSEIIITQSLRVRHTEIGGGADEVGVLDLTHKMNRNTGLTISHTLNWSMGGVAQGYPCMLSVAHNVIDRFQSIGSGLPAADLTANDDSRNFITDQKLLYAWDADGSVAVMIYIPDLVATVENWAKSGVNKFDWRDISADGGSWKKAYANRFGTDETFTADTVWTSEANYRAAWFTDGAANHLS